ncbi:hypothetical protein GCM10027187_44370 [Streptosporangium sandarakinum]
MAYSRGPTIPLPAECLCASEMRKKGCDPSGRTPLAEGPDRLPPSRAGTVRALSRSPRFLPLRRLLRAALAPLPPRGGTAAALRPLRRR